ncbi:MAG: hypothetical protein DRN92_02625 [Thermoproteota archaeon]|nr:MAG: hypothetical protein DRN92_02625 [Candidatus Korarchaeota archaeon]
MTVSRKADRIIFFLTFEELEELCTIDEIPDGPNENKRWKIRDVIAEKARKLKEDLIEKGEWIKK